MDCFPTQEARNALRLNIFNLNWLMSLRLNVFFHTNNPKTKKKQRQRRGKCDWQTFVPNFFYFSLRLESIYHQLIGKSATWLVAATQSIRANASDRCRNKFQFHQNVSFACKSSREVICFSMRREGLLSSEKWRFLLQYSKRFMFSRRSQLCFMMKHSSFHFATDRKAHSEQVCAMIEAEKLSASP